MSTWIERAIRAEAALQTAQEQIQSLCNQLERQLKSSNAEGEGGPWREWCCMKCGTMHTEETPFFVGEVVLCAAGRTAWSASKDVVASGGCNNAFEVEARGATFTLKDF